MDNEVNSWIHYSRLSDEYAKGVEDYLNHAFSTRAQGDQISCPCKDCYNRYWYRRDEVYNHLIAKGIGRGIIEWHFKKGTSSSKPGTRKDFAHDDMEGLVFDTHKDLFDKVSSVHEETEENVSPEVKKFFKLVDDGKQELFPGCKSFSKSSFIIRLYLFKCLHGLSNMAFSDLLEIVQELIPEAKLPKSFHEAKKVVKDFLNYNKIDACRNDCMLYWKDHEHDTSCHVCHAPRWKEVEQQTGTNETDPSQHIRRTPAKKRAEGKPPSLALMNRETRKRTSGIKYKTSEVDIDQLQNKDNELLGRCSKRVKTPSKSGIIIPDEFLQPYREEIVKDAIAGVLKIFEQHLPSEVLGPIASSFENRKGVTEFATTPTNGESSRTINDQVDEDSDGEANNDGDGIDENG